MVFEVLLSALVFNGLVFLASLAIIFFAADLLIDGISSYAQKLGLSDEIIGFVVVALAASMPEVVASVGGLATGELGLMFGTLIGNNMVHTALLIGGLTLIAGKMDLKSKLLSHSKLFVWLLLLLPFLLASDGLLSRADGLILIGAFIAYLAKLWQRERRFLKLKRQVRIENIWRDAAVFLGALVAIILSGRYLVFSAIVISKELEIPAYFIALSVIALASTMPDFIVGLKSIKKGKVKIGLGEIIGSMVIELLLFVGIIALIQPIPVDVSSLFSGAVFLVSSISIALYFIHLGRIRWTHGSLLLLVYVAFFVVELLKLW